MWSTRELADLAGTTVNTVRHYHARGLLEVPERRSNGYKQYQVRHLLRLIEVRRLAELGVPLSEVEGISTRDPSTSAELRQLAAKVEADIERLRQTRSDIAAILQDGAPLGTPRGFEFIARRLSGSDQSLIQIYSRLYGEDVMSDLRLLVAAESGAVREAFDALPPDADEIQRSRVASLMVKDRSSWRCAGHGSARGRGGRRSRVERLAEQTVGEAVVELYNPAQRDVLGRVSQSVVDGDAEPGLLAG